MLQSFSYSMMIALVQRGVCEVHLLYCYKTEITFTDLSLKEWEPSPIWCLLSSLLYR